MNHFSDFKEKNKEFTAKSLLFPQEFSFVKFIAYNIMPDHYHLLIKIIEERIFSKFIGNVENSFTKYINTFQERKGPLWQSRFKAVRIKSNEQLLHTTRYIHLNPTTAGLVENPEDWQLSSYREYIQNPKILKEIMMEVSIKSPQTYKNFVENRKDYQKKLKMIKRLILE